tara:strand:+ start:1276 stop:1836 length:561 start_codon:yes stop_codon:yes gene_type:complete
MKVLHLLEGLRRSGKPHHLSLKDVIGMWQNDGQKLYDDDMPLMMPVRDLMLHREFRWTRGKARSGIARIGNRRVELSGPEKWDAMTADLRENGWDRREPLYFEIGRDSGQKVGEGNHRLAIASKLGIAKVPVVFKFKSGKVRKDRLESPVMVRSKAVKSSLVKSSNAPIDPESEKRVRGLMDLLGL